MTWEIFFSLSFKLITTEIVCRWSSDSKFNTWFFLEINGEIFTISPNVRCGCVTLARNTSIIRRKDRGCGFPEYFVVTNNFIFRWLGIFSIFLASKWPPQRAFFHEMRLQLALRDRFWVSSAQNRQRSGYWLKAIRIVFFQVLVLRKDRNGTYNL